MKKFSVAFETTTVDIWEVNASSQNEATMKATEERFLHIGGVENHEPTHTHTVKMRLLPVKPTVTED